MTNTHYNKKGRGNIMTGSKVTSATTLSRQDSTTKPVKLVIVGHVDHGKSTLIGRLLYDSDSLPQGLMEEIEQSLIQLGKPVEFAYIMDHLEEERVEEKTIDTAQSFFKTDKRTYVIIDTPGHKEFIKNMLTGASQADAAILIVSALEGIEEQTSRHAYILSMLGLKQVILAINKMDLVSYNQTRFQELRDEALLLLDSMKIRPQYTIPISAKLGDNIGSLSPHMAWYQGPFILEALDYFNIRESISDKPFRFPIQDIYQLSPAVGSLTAAAGNQASITNQQKKILVGRVASGRVRAGDEVIILPPKIKTKIRSIEVFQDKRGHGEEEVKLEAEAGESIGLILEDDIDIKRGQVICAYCPSSPAPEPLLATRINTNIFWISPKPLNLNQQPRLTIRCATAEEVCSIEKIETRLDSSSLEIIEEDGRVLEETEVGKVIISIDKPMVFEDFNEIEELGRFVLVKDGEICAGGIITLL
jgi:small GTP-binding protein